MCVEGAEGEKTSKLSGEWFVACARLANGGGWYWQVQKLLKSKIVKFVSKLLAVEEVTCFALTGFWLRLFAN